MHVICTHRWCGLWCFNCWFQARPVSVAANRSAEAPRAREHTPSLRHDTPLLTIPPPPISLFLPPAMKSIA